MLANIAAKSGLRRDQMCVVGDRLDTDIQFGLDGGLMTMLVLSGAPAAAPPPPPPPPCFRLPTPAVRLDRRAAAHRRACSWLGPTTMRPADGGASSSRLAFCGRGFSASVVSMGRCGRVSRHQQARALDDAPALDSGCAVRAACRDAKTARTSVTPQV